ncbi:MAG: PA14 domain-containing protein [Chitinophagaceae bacterium]
MKKFLFFAVVAIFLSSNDGFGQANIFNPNDPVVTYDAAHPPVTPPDNLIATWVRTVRTSWNTDKFKAYYYNGMAFRVRFPNGYNPNDNTKKYPMILFLHGGGESAGIYDNEYQLFLEAQKFQTMIDNGQWNGFLLFPQCAQASLWEFFHFDRINVILDNLTANCHLDPDRVVTTGLSMGGFGSLRYSGLNPKYSAMAIGSSPALVETLTDVMYNGLIQVPVWVGNGGTDTNPEPTSVENFKSILTSKGGSVRHSYFPQEYHFVWDFLYDKPDIIKYYNTAHKANPVIYNSKNQYAAGATVNSKLGLTPGFAEYQWQRNNVDIPGAGSNEYTATQLGSYRARFRRVAGGGWSDWSLVPAVIFTSDAVAAGPGNVNGLSYKYFEGNWNALPDFNSLTPVKTGVTPNVDVSVRTAGKDEYYAFVWEGKIQIPATGKYTFEIASDDGSRLYLNKYYSPNTVPLIDNDGSHGDVPTMGAIQNLTAGSSLPIALTYFQSWGGQNIKLYWTGPGISRQEIPNSAFSNVSIPVDNTPPTVPSNLQVAGKTSNSVNLTWTASTDAVGVTRYDIFENGASKYSSTTASYNVTGLSANTSYTYTVKAFDATGNPSALSAPVNVTTNPVSATSGLSYRYYEGDWNVLPNYSLLTPIKTGTVSNIDLNMRNINDYFGVVWEGYITLPTTGVYTFELASDDGSKFYFNSLYNFGATALVNSDGTHGDFPTATGSTGSMSAGAYPMALAYFQKWGGESMVLYWTGPGIPRQVVPASAFTPNPPSADVQAPSVPTGLQVTSTGTTFLNLGWNNSTDNVGVARYDIYENGNLKYTSVAANFLVTGLSPNTTYSYTVRAADQAGNVSAQSSTISPKTSGSGSVSGLNYRYYEGDWNAVPNFNTLTPVKTGTTPNFDLSIRNIEDYFGVVWEGYINIPYAGNWTFEIGSDDGSLFYWNSLYAPTTAPFISNDGLHGDVPTVSRTANGIAAGAYPISVAYFEKWGGQNMVMYWTGPNTPRQQVPNSAFSSQSALTTTAISTIAQRSATVLNEVSNLSEIGNKLKVSAYPNPFIDRFTIEYNSPVKNSKVDIQIYDLNGRLVSAKYFGALPSGTSLLKMDINEQQLQKGIYLAKVNIDGVPAKMIKLVRTSK